MNREKYDSSGERIKPLVDELSSQSAATLRMCLYSREDTILEVYGHDPVTWSEEQRYITTLAAELGLGGILLKDPNDPPRNVR